MTAKEFTEAAFSTWLDKRRQMRRRTADYFRDEQGRLWKWTRKAWRLMRRARVRGKP